MSLHLVYSKTVPTNFIVGHFRIVRENSAKFFCESLFHDKLEIVRLRKFVPKKNTYFSLRLNFGQVKPKKVKPKKTIPIYIANAGSQFFFAS